MLNGKRKLAPCDCHDIATAAYLQEHGIKINNDGITVRPGVVILERGHTTITIPMRLFKIFAQWYLEKQELRDHNDPQIENYLHHQLNR